MGSEHHVQEPVAIIGMACRLPGENNSPRALWEFLERGGIASNDVPANRFNLKGHYDGSRKPGTMRPPGGMFLESVDLADFDAPFFEISRAEAVSMDPNQRQMLEVVYESLENAGITLGSLDGASVGCFVGSYAVGMSLLTSHNRGTMLIPMTRLSRHSKSRSGRQTSVHRGGHWACYFE